MNNHLTKKTMTYDVGKPGPGLRHAQKFGRVISLIVVMY